MRQLALLGFGLGLGLRGELSNIRGSSEAETAGRPPAPLVPAPWRLILLWMTTIALLCGPIGLVDNLGWVLHAFLTQVELHHLGHGRGGKLEHRKA